MDLNKKAVVFCLTIMMLLSLHTTDGYGSGPPVNNAALCTDMTPVHGGSSQSSAAPYTITASPTCYTPGQAVTGRILNCTIRDFSLCKIIM